MPHLTQPAALEAMCQRINALTPADQPHWGTMSVGAMLCHLYDGCQIALSRLDPGPKIPSMLASALGRWLVIRSPMPWPKGGVKAPPAFLTTPAEEFDADRQRLLAIIQEHAQYQGPWGVSPQGDSKLTLGEEFPLRGACF
ncbi:MAG: hypothetical protein EA401_06945 [Planctomycetota bacterium]|nr:MAG: hypothetical protein EA401_06945 [Planctomycetota bacterium]